MQIKAKKELEKLANNSLSEFKNDVFKRELLDKQKQIQHAEKHKAKPYFATKWKVITSMASVVLAVVIVLVCVLLVSPQKDVPEGGGKHYAYNDDNVSSKDASIDDINIGGYSLNDEYVVRVKLLYDNESGDNLYYRVTWDNEDRWMDCYVDFIINPHYEPATKTYEKVIEINALKIKYNEKCEFDEEDELYTYKIDGETTIGDVLIRFENYCSIMETQDNGFEEFINNLFIKK